MEIGKEKVISHFPPIIIPVCIYHRDSSSGGTTQGYLGTPGIDESGKQVLMCAEPAVSYQGWYKAGNFYGINPMFVPLPSYMRLICALQSRTAERNYNTVDISTQYDPFDDQPNCVYFLTWTLPVPYTTPLYLYNSSNGVLPSFEKRDDLKKNSLDTLYVLTDEPMEHTIFVDKKKWFKKWKDGTPNFLFKSYMGRCVPEPDGVPLEQCTLTHNLNMIEPTSLLQNLQKMAKDNKSKFSRSVPRFFKKVGIPWVAIIFGIFLLALFVVLFTVFKNKNDNNGKSGYRRKT